MSIVKSFAVGNGDMFYIAHNSDNFSIIDCCLSDDNSEEIVRELKGVQAEKGVLRFISTHPDDDHFRGITYLDEQLNLSNFYCVKNAATKEDETDDFVHYCTLRDNAKNVFYLSRGCSRRWMNLDDEERTNSGLHVLWPVLENEYFQLALEDANSGGSPNNISLVLQYLVQDGGKFLWMGDLETDFMENIADAIDWPKTDIVFAAHHGRNSGRIPHAILDQLKPKIIVLGEAPSRHLNYYGGYNTLAQNSAGNMTFNCVDAKVHIFVSEPNYGVDFLEQEDVDGPDYYIGTLNT